MKSLLALLSLTLSFGAFAEHFSGKVVVFKGHYVETGRPYAYAALKVEGVGRYALPAIINAQELAKFENNSVEFDADAEMVYCTDMSSACISHVIKNVKSVRVTLKEPTPGEIVVTGKLQRFTGVGVETRRAYDYISFSDRNVAVPSIFNAEELLKADAEITAVGVVRNRICIDISKACGPAPIAPLTQMSVNF